MKKHIVIGRVVLGATAAVLALISCRAPKPRAAQGFNRASGESVPARDENGMLLDRPKSVQGEDNDGDAENASARIINKAAQGRQFGFAVRVEGGAGTSVDCLVENRKTSALVFNQEIKDLESDSVQKDFTFTSNSNPADLVISVRMKSTNRLLDQVEF